jgi:RNA polymerase sigma-70 factor (ECF subfamily)
MNPDVELVEAARRGDRDAQSSLVATYQRPIFSVCYRMLGDASDAEDAAQETFLKAFRALDAYDPARPFSTWILSIAAHHCIDRLRRRRETVISLDALPKWRWKPVDTPDPEREAVRADEAERIGRLLQTLPDDYRLVIVLRYWHDFGYEEIAAILGDTESAVKSRLHRARRQLAASLGNPAAGGSDAPSGSGNGQNHSPGPGTAAEPAATPVAGGGRLQRAARFAKGGWSACPALMPVP